MKKFIDRQIMLHFYVFKWLKVGGPSIDAAHEGQKVGGGRGQPGPIASAAYGGRSGQSGQTIKLFQAPPKITFTFHFWHKFFILDDVKLAELSNNSFE